MISKLWWYWPSSKSFHTRKSQRLPDYSLEQSNQDYIEVENFSKKAYGNTLNATVS